jgi:leucyl aminopeptidase (aminopeptidase T)
MSISKVKDMIKDVSLINKHSQIRELGSEVKFNILKELIKGSATCQQLANIYGTSKQKVHYNLSKLLKEGLIEISPLEQVNAKEVYYRATAKNFVLDFSVGQSINDNTLNNREIIDSILVQEYRISLNKIAAKLLDDSLKVKPRERMMIVTGKYNLPLVEKILLEASRRGVATTMIYQDTELLRAKYEEFSLAAFDSDYERFNSLLQNQDIYLNLNGEVRYQELTDPMKQKIRNRHFAKSRQILQQKGIRVAIMPGLLPHTLEDKTIESELQFWKALDIDYPALCRRTNSLCSELASHNSVSVNNCETNFSFEVQKVLAECGSFSNSEFQSPVINLPGGEILIIPRPMTLHGEIKADLAYISGERVDKPVIRLKNNKIVEYSAQNNADVLEQAIAKGGRDGKSVALICLGTNDNILLENIDSSYKHKSQGLMTVYWGENLSLGGSVAGENEWYIQIENPQLTYK